MIIALNGPLGIGKSTLAEALSESIASCVSLDGDHLVAVNPEPESSELLHATLSLLIGHYQGFGYRHFVINHLWLSHAEWADLAQRLSRLDHEIHFFRLTLPKAENLRRIELRASTRALDERDFEQRTFAQEHAILTAAAGTELGEPFEVSGSPAELVEGLLKRVGLIQRARRDGED